MKKIGNLKNQVLSKLTESYSRGNKKEIKQMISLLKENKDFRELYLFYDEFENKNFDSKESATLYLESVIPFLQENYNNLLKSKDFFTKLNNLVEGIDVECDSLYDDLDVLLEKKKISNIDRKISAKNTLVEHLTTKKGEVVLKDIPVVSNEGLFYSILSNNFNNLYDNELNEEQKTELKKFISISDEDLITNIEELKENVIDKISDLLVESTGDVSTKLEETKKEVEKMKPTKYNLYKLQQLENGL